MPRRVRAPCDDLIVGLYPCGDIVILRSRTARECSPNWVVDPTQGLNISERPIADKYREGKMKRTPGGESKVPEIVGRETLEDEV